jgi:hypothetical protein
MVLTGLVTLSAAATPLPQDINQQNERRPERKQERQQAPPVQRPSPAARPQNDRPPGARHNAPMAPAPASRSAEANRPPQNANPYPGSGANRQREFTPEENQRLQQNRQRFNRLPPQQQQELRDRAEVWQRMTPEQRQYVKNDVLPKWREMPQDRRQTIQQKLRVLRDMPESARNRRLSDPNFTHGMSEQDRSTLRELSHLHVGGALEPPNE